MVSLRAHKCDRFQFLQSWSSEEGHMRRRDFIAGTAASAALGFAQPLSAQTETRSPVIKRIAMFHPSEPSEGLSINGRRAYKAFFGALNNLGYNEGQNLIVER